MSESKTLQEQCYGTCWAACEEIASLELRVAELTKERGEADRRAGAAERSLAFEKDTTYRRTIWLDEAKKQWGVDRNVSFDVIWEECLTLKRQVAELTAKLAEKEQEVSQLTARNANQVLAFLDIEKAMNLKIDGKAEDRTVGEIVKEARKVIKHLASAEHQLAEARKDSEWRPISEAPKDGTVILVTNDKAGGSWVARYNPIYPSGFRPENPWQSMMLNHDHIPNKGKSHIPTLWQPLPPAPSTE